MPRRSIVDDGRIPVIIIDPYPVYRRGVRECLSASVDLYVASESDAWPDVDPWDSRAVILVAASTDSATLETCAALVHRPDSPRIVVVCEAAGDLMAAARAGVHGVVARDVQPDELVSVVTRVAAGGISLSSDVAARALQELGGRGRAADMLGELTMREREILQLLAQGLSNRQIADVLFISENTTKNHVRSVLAKLQVKSRTEAVAVGSRTGLVRL